MAAPGPGLWSQCTVDVSGSCSRHPVLPRRPGLPKRDHARGVAIVSARGFETSTATDYPGGRHPPGALVTVRSRTRPSARYSVRSRGRRCRRALCARDGLVAGFANGQGRAVEYVAAWRPCLASAVGLLGKINEILGPGLYSRVGEMVERPEARASVWGRISTEIPDDPLKNWCHRIRDSTPSKGHLGGCGSRPQGVRWNVKHPARGRVARRCRRVPPHQPAKAASRCGETPTSPMHGRGSSPPDAGGP